MLLGIMSIDFWKKEALKQEGERIELEYEVGELKEVLGSSEDEVAKLRAELTKACGERDESYRLANILRDKLAKKWDELEEVKERVKWEKEALVQKLSLVKAEAEGLWEAVWEHEEGKVEVEAERERRCRLVDRGVQSEVVGVTAIGAQTIGRTYAIVVAQTEDGGKKMDVDGASRDLRGVGSLSGDPARKPAGTTPVGDHPVRTFVVHGVACNGPCAHRSREVENAFRRRGGRVIGMRWLLQWGRRRGRPFTFMVVYLRRAITTTGDSVRLLGKRHRVEEYQWDRQPRGWD